MDIPGLICFLPVTAALVAFLGYLFIQLIRAGRQEERLWFRLPLLLIGGAWLMTLPCFAAVLIFKFLDIDTGPLVRALSSSTTMLIVPVFVLWFWLIVSPPMAAFGSIRKRVPCRYWSKELLVLLTVVGVLTAVGGVLLQGWFESMQVEAPMPGYDWPVTRYGHGSYYTCYIPRWVEPFSSHLLWIGIPSAILFGSAAFFHPVRYSECEAYAAVMRKPKGSVEEG